MDNLYKHSPYEGLVALRERKLGPSNGLGQDLESACADAERELGCVPSGRLRTYVLLSAAAAMLQRVRDASGVPLFIVKGGLIWQELLGSSARPTYDLDGTLTCGVDEFISRARESLVQPWGSLRGRIEEAITYEGLTVAHTLFRFNLVLSEKGEDIATIPCEGSFGEPDFMLKTYRYSAVAIDVVGLPVPDALWGIRLARGICSKLLNVTEPLTGPDGTRAGYQRPHRKAKHLVDAILLSCLCEEGTYCTYEELAETLKKRVVYENEARIACGYAPFDSPLRPLPYDDWAVEYLIAAIQSGLNLRYADALAEIGALFERLDP